MRSIQSSRSRRAVSISNLRGRRRKLRHHSPKNTSTAIATAGATSATMHKKLRNLQRLVPGGHEADLNHLFQRTADYIFALQLKLNVLKDLTSFYGV